MNMRSVVKVIVNIIVIVISLTGSLLMGAYVMGITPTIVSSGSMEPLIPTGSICFIDTKFPFEELKVGDVIVYKQPTQKVIHRIVEKGVEEYKTKGDANKYIDGLSTTRENYYGKYIFSIPKAGYFIHELQYTTGKIMFVIGIIVLYLLCYSLNRKDED